MTRLAKQTIGLFAAVLAVFFVASFVATPQAHAEDTRRIITDVQVSSSDFAVPTNGASTTAPTFTTTRGTPAYVASAYWRKLNESTNIWEQYSGSTFSAGKYVLAVQVRIDEKTFSGFNKTTHKLADQITFRVNGADWTRIWPTTYQNSETGYSYTSVWSPEYTVGESTELIFHDSSSFDIPENKVGDYIEGFSVYDAVEGGQKPYSFSLVYDSSDTSGSNSGQWLHITTSTGVISGRHLVPVLQAGEFFRVNDPLTVRVTDATGAHKEIEIAVGNTYPLPSDRVQVHEVVGTNVWQEGRPNVAELPLVGSQAQSRMPDIAIVEGSPARFFDYAPYGYWMKYTGSADFDSNAVQTWNPSNWTNMAKTDTFQEGGIYRFYAQVSISRNAVDGLSNRTHILADPLTVTVDDEEWENVFDQVDINTVTDVYSMDVVSPPYRAKQSIAGATITGIHPKMPYANMADVTQDDIVVKLGSTTLVKDRDYHVYYSNNQARGVNTAKVWVTGTGWYTGKSADYTYSILDPLESIDIDIDYSTFSGLVPGEPLRNQRGDFENALAQNSFDVDDDEDGWYIYDFDLVKKVGDGSYVPVGYDDVISKDEDYYWWFNLEETGAWCWGDELPTVTANGTIPAEAQWGAMHASEGYSGDLDALVPAAFEDDLTNMHVTYRSGVEGSTSWQGWVSDGALSGTVGKSLRMEGLQIKLENAPYGGGIEYKSQLQSDGWEQDWKRDGATSGYAPKKTGGKRLEAVQIRLYGKMAERYDVWYHLQVQRFGWMGWVKNGEVSGTVGYAFRVEAVEVVLTPKGAPAPTVGHAVATTESNMLSYVRCRSYDNKVWQGAKGEGDVSGTRNQVKTQVRVGLAASSFSAAGINKGNSVIEVRVFQDGKWSGWSSEDDAYVGNAKGGPIRGIQARLKSGSTLTSHFDLYYRVEVKDGTGKACWLGWAKEGETAGQSNLNLEQLEFSLQLKDEAAPPTNASEVQSTISHIKQRWVIERWPCNWPKPAYRF